MDNSDAFPRRRWKLECVNRARESARVDQDIRIQDPKDVVLSLSIGSNEVVDFGVYADLFVA